MNKTAILASILILFSFCKPSSEFKKSSLTNTYDPSVQTDDEKIIRSMRQRYNEAIQYHDTIGITTVWGNDFEMLTSRNVQIKGTENNRRSFANEFTNKPNVKYTRTPSEIKTFPQWRMASEYGTWVGQWAEQDGLVTIKGTYYAKWHFTGHEWKLRMEVFTAESCNGSKYCDKVPILEESVNF